MTFQKIYNNETNGKVDMTQLFQGHNHNDKPNYRKNSFMHSIYHYDQKSLLFLQNKPWSNGKSESSNSL